jgi:hypothetical protein
VRAGKGKRKQKGTVFFLHAAAPQLIKIDDFLRRTIVKVGMRVDGNVSAAFLTLDTELLFSTLRFFHAASLSERCRRRHDGFDRPQPGMSRKWDVSLFIRYLFLMRRNALRKSRMRQL